MKVQVPNIILPWDYIKAGDILEVAYIDGSGNYFETKCGIYSSVKNSVHLIGSDWIIVQEGMPNREFLADFIKLNNIKKTLVSKYLGMAENWLTTMVNEKRSNRKDISDETLKDIMRKLHIDWTSQEFINVKATKSNTEYKTQPCNYSRVVDKERLQRSMWNGELVV